MRFRVAPTLALLAAIASSAAAKPKPIPVKVVIVTMFEVGEDTGDKPGELQYWVERDHLDRVYPLPAAYHAVRMNETARWPFSPARARRTPRPPSWPLGLDPRFDFSHAYWIVAGIAGASPDRASLGSAAGPAGLSMAIWPTKSTPARFRPTGRPATFPCARRSPSKRPPSRSPARSTHSMQASLNGPST